MAKKVVKVAIDKSPLVTGDKVRGIGFHTKLLLENLKDKEGVEIKSVDFSKAKLSEFDILHYPKFHPYFFSLPISKKGKSVLTIHDLIPLVYPDKYPAGVRGKTIFGFQKALVKKMDRIITISETSKKDIVDFLNYPSSKVHAIHLAPREIFRQIKKKTVLEKVRQKYDLPSKFVLYVGDVNYNKNILRLAEAVKSAGVNLVMVGKQAVDEDVDLEHPENRDFAKFLRLYSDDEDIKRLGYVSDKDLVSLFNLSTFYCQPSLYEGFGLPVLEAMASGSPVLASKIGAHEEIAGDAALFMNPKKVKDMAGKIKKMYEDEDLRDKFRKKGLRKVKKYSWKKTAEETLDVYRKCL